VYLVTFVLSGAPFSSTTVEENHISRNCMNRPCAQDQGIGTIGSQCKKHRFYCPCQRLEFQGQNVALVLLLFTFAEMINVF